MFFQTTFEILFCCSVPWEILRGTFKVLGIDNTLDEVEVLRNQSWATACGKCRV
jgi:hypothetical protein